MTMLCGKRTCGSKIIARLARSRYQIKSITKAKLWFWGEGATLAWHVREASTWKIGWTFWRFPNCGWPPCSLILEIIWHCQIIFFKNGPPLFGKSQKILLIFRVEASLMKKGTMLAVALASICCTVARIDSSAMVNPVNKVSIFRVIGAKSLWHNEKSYL